MKVLVIGDVHWSQYSSILRKRGVKYSYRLENLIESINWAENIAEQSGCKMIVYLGDFFDKPNLNAEEISALDAIQWSDIEHYFLVGNHESGMHDLEFNSTNVFKLNNSYVIQTPTIINNPYSNSDCPEELIFLPYISESNRKLLCEYIHETNNKRIIFSHNDLKGIQMGKFISKEGFSIDEIQNNCDLFLNGHLHNGTKVADKIINVGNLTGQNFSEDAFIYDHSIIILDTETLQCAVYENPYALNFYKLDLTDVDIDIINDISSKLKQNSIITIKCNDNNLDYLRKRFNIKYKDDIVPFNCNVIESRFIIQSDNIKINNKQETFSINHLESFKDYMINLLGNNDILIEELQEVCM